MDSGLLIVTGVALAVIVLAVVLTRLFGNAGRRRKNADKGGGRAEATWIGIRQTRDIDAD